MSKKLNIFFKVFIGTILFIFANFSIAENQSFSETKKNVDNHKNIIIIGPPASGKGTQAQLISKELNIPQISTGDLLRSEIAKNTTLGQKIQEIIAFGNLVDDEIVIKLLKERLNQDDTKNGFILDGFPRTLDQAKYLDNENITIDYVIELQVPDEIILKRITGRRIHPASGRTYHIEYNPPKVADTDDITGEPLIQREDDTEEVIIERLARYHELTKPVIDYYKTKANENSVQYIIINGTENVSDIYQQIIQKIAATDSN